MKYKLRRSAEILPGDAPGGYFGAAESPFHCYEPLDMLLRTFDSNQINGCREFIIRLYEWVYSEPEYFFNTEIPIERIQKKLVDQFETWVKGNV